MTNWVQLSPSRLHHLRFGVAFGSTDVGTVRSSNEDNFLINEALGLVMLGDGMGGHHGGEIASAEALCSVRDFIRAAQHAATEDDDKTISPMLFAHNRAAFEASDPEATWSDANVPAVLVAFDAIEHANQHLFKQNVAQEIAEGEGMGTTLTGFWRPSLDGPIVVFHVGDSRLYRYRSGEMTIMTRDQTQYQAAIDSGLLINLPPRNFLLQAIGPTPTVKPDVHAHAVVPGDLFMLCSDGLHGPVPYAEIDTVMASVTADRLEQACGRLIALAKEYGGRDNITVVMARIHD